MISPLVFTDQSTNLSLCRPPPDNPTSTTVTTTPSVCVTVCHQVPSLPQTVIINTKTLELLLSKYSDKTETEYSGLILSYCENWGSMKCSLYMWVHKLLANWQKKRWYVMTDDLVHTNLTSSEAGVPESEVRESTTWLTVESWELPANIAH